MVILGWIVYAIIFGVITDHVAASKGYDDGFWWGFFLGIIGLMVVGFRVQKEGQVKNQERDSQLSNIQMLNDLRKQGVITDNVYQKKIDEILEKYKEESKYEEGTDGETVIPIKLGTSGYKCPKCRKSQSSSEKKCVACGARFVTDKTK